MYYNLNITSTEKHRSQKKHMVDSIWLMNAKYMWIEVIYWWSTTIFEFWKTFRSTPTLFVKFKNTCWFTGCHIKCSRLLEGWSISDDWWIMGSIFWTSYDVDFHSYFGECVEIVIIRHYCTIAHFEYNWHYL